MYRYEIERIERERERREKEIFEKTPNRCKGNDKRYISLMSSISHTYGNVLAWFQQYMLSLVPENTFKTIHVSSKIAHRQIRSTNHEFLKKSKPMIIFRPRIADMNEERFLKGTPMIEKQYGLYSTWGNSTLQPFMDDPKHDISVKFQQNRSVMNIDVTMIFTTLLAQMDFVHYLQNAIVFRSFSAASAAAFVMKIHKKYFSILSRHLQCSWEKFMICLKVWGRGPCGGESVRRG